jgi:hypothetical protein
LSSISIAGNTSGTITLDAPNVAGTTVLTLPTTSGTVVTTTSGSITSSQVPTGSVVQVVQTVLTGSVSTTSTTDVSSGLTASITPSSTSNKILLMVAGGKAYIASGAHVIVTAYRNGSTLGSGARSTPIEGSANGSNHSLNYLDSPSSTSSVTYTIYYRSSTGATAYFADSNTYGNATLTLMEIKG